MKADIFNNWLEYLDKGFKITNHHIAMIIDNVASHNLAISAEDTESESEKEFSSNITSSSTSIINYNNKRKKMDNQKKEKEIILKHLHDDKTAGHLGQNITINKIKE